MEGEPAQTEMARCTCGSPLSFAVVGIKHGGYGQTVERCANRQCLNHFAHHPIPDLSGKVPKEPRYRKRRPRS